MKEFVINKKVKLKKGGRKAQKMTKDEFINKFYDYLVKYFKKNPEDWENSFEGYPHFEEDLKKFKGNFPIGDLNNFTLKDLKELFDNLDDECTPLPPVIWDYTQKYKVNFNWENCGCVKFDITNEGIPYLIVWAGGDWEYSVYIYFYFDDKNNLRNYIPTKGNTFNRYTMTAFGSEEENDKLDEICKKFGVDQDEYPEESLKLEILKKEGVDLSQFKEPYEAFDYMSPDFDMMTEDFSSRVVL